MKNKIKLTDLSHLEPLNDEMVHLKGGENPEEGPLCFGCNCGCSCSGENSDNNVNSTYNTKRHGGFVSTGIVTVVVGITVALLI